LFNKKQHTLITECIGQYGLLHIQLEPDKYLKEIIVEPDGISVDILFGDDMLIYEFYNPTKNDTVTIRATQADDKDDICTKIRLHKDDLEFRQYYIRQALKKPGITPMDKPRIVYPEWLTVGQVAELLSITKKSVYNRTHRGQLKVYKVGGVNMYKKSELEK